MTRTRSRSLATGLLIVAMVAGCAGSAAPMSPEPTFGAVSGTVPTRLAEPDLGGANPSAAARPARSPSVATPAATPSTASPTAAAAESVAPARPFAMNLYERGDYVRQYTFEWCVGASIQMALALADASVDTSRASQQRLWEMARDRSFSPFGGANPRGWTAVLNELGIGPYELVSAPDLATALQLSAEAIRATERPVGLVMWRGRHAWVMSGFESIGDPRERDDVRVTGVRVLDPLHPHGSRTWGASPEPNSLLTPEELGRQFVIRDSRRVNLGVPAGYLLVLPTTAPVG